MTLRAILLDFDGVMADTELTHLKLFQEILEKEGIVITQEVYFEKYLGLDDKSCLKAIFQDHNKRLSSEKRDRLIKRKNEAMLSLLSGDLLLPDTIPFVNEVSGNYFLAIVSGALRSEIDSVLKAAKLEMAFPVIVGADDVAKCKPHPEGLLTAVRLLNKDSVPPSEILIPQECLVVEDSPWGIEAAKRAKMRCAALTTSYQPERLHGADWIVTSLSKLDLEAIKKVF